MNDEEWTKAWRLVAKTARLERLARLNRIVPPDAVLNARIAELRMEAALHGDLKQVQLCELALDGGALRPGMADLGAGDEIGFEAIVDARAACVEVLADAEAQIDDDGQLDLFAE
jgi:hypothetical protein